MPARCVRRSSNPHIIFAHRSSNGLTIGIYDRISLKYLWNSHWNPIEVIQKETHLPPLGLTPLPLVGERLDFTCGDDAYEGPRVGKEG